MVRYRPPECAKYQKPLDFGAPAGSRENAPRIQTGTHVLHIDILIILYSLLSEEFALEVCFGKK